LWLAGFAAMQKGDAEGAVGRWQRLLEVVPPDSEQLAVVRDLIARAQASPASTAAAAPPVGSMAASIEAVVRLAPGLQSRVSGDETLFVFARAASGPPMPLAIQRRSSAELPVTLVLDDSMGMVDSLKLSSFDSVVVGARISASGNASARSGDLQGFSAPIPVSGDAKVELVIDEVVP
jgi:cytochrome c-type biogenesis protein CcmH